LLVAVTSVLTGGAIVAASVGLAMTTAVGDGGTGVEVGMTGGGGGRVLVGNGVGVSGGG
jgi:hypothetical protein